MLKQHSARYLHHPDCSVADSGKRRGGLLGLLGIKAQSKPALMDHQADRSVIGDDPAALHSTLPFEWGPSAGWLDPNTQFTPTYLHGNSSSPGKLLEIRRTDEVIGPAVDARRELMASFDYEVRPRPRMLHNARAQRVAIQVGARLDSMPGTSLPWWMSETYDHWFTSGFSLDEIVLDQFDRLTLAHIRPGLVQRFDPDATGRGFSSAIIRTRRGQTPIAQSKLSYIARNPEPGEFRGQSGIRCMIATAETSLQLYSALLQSIRLSMGFPYLSESDKPGLLTTADKTNAMKAMSKLLRGESDLAFFGKKIEPQILSSQTPAMQQFGPLAQFGVERKQAAAHSALSNLGMRGVGSRSLGETVNDADMRRLRAHLDIFMRTVSGDHHLCGTLMRTLTEMEGEHPDLAPEIVIRWDDGTAERKSREHIALVATLVKDGVLSKTPALNEWLRQQLQVPNV